MNDQLYSFQELRKKFNWKTDCTGTMKDKIIFAGARGVAIEPIQREGVKWLFKIVNTPEECFTQKEILKKYNLDNYLDKVIPNFVNFALRRGILLEKQSFCKRPIYYKILSDNFSTYTWVSHPSLPQFEVCKEGYVRQSTSKNIYTAKNTYGYIQILDKETNSFYLAHRLILETFNPIDNANIMNVDHINGIRSDNRLENLRWVTQQENMMYRQDNWEKIQDNFNKLLQMIGYEEMNKILENELNKINNEV